MKIHAYNDLSLTDDFQDGNTCIVKYDYNYKFNNFEIVSLKNIQWNVDFSVYFAKNMQMPIFSIASSYFYMNNTNFVYQNTLENKSY